MYVFVRRQELSNQRHVFPAAASEQQATESTRLRQVWLQALFYALASFNSLFSVIVTVIEKEIFYNSLGWRNTYIFFFMTGYLYLMFPLQGFLNSLVFMRPRVAQWREAHPEQSLVWCIRQVLRLEQLSPHRHHRGISTQQRSSVPDSKRSKGLPEDAKQECASGAATRPIPSGDTGDNVAGDA